jgi:hypothetical protein
LASWVGIFFSIFHSGPLFAPQDVRKTAEYLSLGIGVYDEFCLSQLV